MSVKFFLGLSVVTLLLATKAFAAEATGVGGGAAATGAAPTKPVVPRAGGTAHGTAGAGAASNSTIPEIVPGTSNPILGASPGTPTTAAGTQGQLPAMQNNPAFNPALNPSAGVAGSQPTIGAGVAGQSQPPLSGGTNAQPLQSASSGVGGAAGLGGNILVSRLIGRAVRDQNNEQIGSVTDLVIDDVGGVTAIVIGVGRYLGSGEKRVAVPFINFRSDGFQQRSDALTVNETKDQLNAAPEFTGNADAQTAPAQPAQ